MPAILSGQNTDSTLGVVTLNTDYNEANSTIRILNQDLTTWYEFNFYYTDTAQVWPFPKDSFEPLSFHPDYMLLHLTCLDTFDNLFRVVANQSTGLVKYVENNGLLKLMTWEQYVLSMFSIENDQDTNPIRDEINGVPLDPDFDFDDPVHPVEIHDDWLEVEWDDGAGRRRTGWLIWRKNGQIIVELYPIS